MYVMRGVGLRRPAVRIKAFDVNTTAIPVMRLEDNNPISFYYHASGCSDTYVHANQSNGMVVHDRIDAIARLTSSVFAAKMLREWCAAELHRYSEKNIANAIFTKSYVIITESMHAMRSMISGSGCLNIPIYQHMRTRGIDTLVLNYEVPGGDVVDFSQRKTEIIHLSGRLFNASGRPCAAKWLRGCLYCEGSVLSFAMCNGTLRELLAQSDNQTNVVNNRSHYHTHNHSRMAVVERTVPAKD
jgi:hypothetical protein